jgi:xylan 1,4-beta-xylosidase
MLQTEKAAALFLAVATAVFITPPAFAASYTITVNGATKQGTVPHFWSRCVGTGGAQLCLDARWKAHAKIAVTEAGFQAFRGHRILTVSNPITWSGAGATPTFNFNAFDQIYDFLVDTLKTVPVVELSSMPTPLQTNGEWSPPKDYTVWGTMIKALVAHCITRYGQAKVRTWIWEVWNEWNYPGFWTNGTEAQYYQLYQKAVEGAKSVDSLIKIGGPSSTSGGQDQAFVNFCNSNNVKYDAVTNHCYGQGATGISDPAGIRNDNRTRSNAISSTKKTLLSLNTEFNSSYSGQGGNMADWCISMDSHVNAPFVAKVTKLLLDDHTAGTYQVPDVMSYWAISDVFDEGSWYASHSTTPFGEVFGLINQQGIRKATFNAYKMLNMMGTSRLALTGGTGDADGVDGFATLSSDNAQVAVLVYNFYKQLAGQTAIDNVALSVSLPFSNGTSVEVRHYRVDSLHSNAYAVWLKQGKPSNPSTTQLTDMQTASNLAELNPVKTVTYSGTAYSESFTLPRQAVSLLVFKNTAVRIGGAPAVVPKPSRPALSVIGTTLRISGDYNGPIEAVIYRLDGKEVTRLNVTRNGSDLAQVLPKGTFLAHAAQGGDRRAMVKVVIDR